MAAIAYRIAEDSGSTETMGVRKAERQGGFIRIANAQKSLLQETHALLFQSQLPIENPFIVHHWLAMAVESHQTPISPHYLYEQSLAASM